MELSNIQAVYFIGVGGIGMSALVRYFLAKGKVVAGYDRTATPLTAALINEGADIHYAEDPALIPAVCQDPAHTLVVYTPAIPPQHKEYQYFLAGGFTIEKRAQVLGTITCASRALCVAGTHGKTTTSTMLAHLLQKSRLKCNAFLGGIAQNYNTNLLLADNDWVVIEADEYDRSFHQLTPHMAVITSADPDHLDIYGTPQAYYESFRHFTSLMQPGGTLLMQADVELAPVTVKGVTYRTYSLYRGDYHAQNVRCKDGEITFDFVSPMGVIKDVELGVPIYINIENGVAAMALAQLCGATDDELREGMRTFKGVQRRFQLLIKTPLIACYADYAHHPAEIAQCAKSMRHLYEGKPITVIFQPHLYSRTRDFYEAFAESLSLFDEVLLTEIYPAREAPIVGVTSQLIYDKLSANVRRTYCPKAQVVDWITTHTPAVLVLLGAGDIDALIPQIVQQIAQK